MLKVAFISNNESVKEQANRILKNIKSVSLVMEFESIDDYTSNSLNANLIFIHIKIETDIHNVLRLPKLARKYCILENFTYLNYRKAVDCGADGVLTFENFDENLHKTLSGESENITPLITSSALHSTFNSLDDVVVVINKNQEIVNVYNDKDSTLFQKSFIGETFDMLPIPESIIQKINLSISLLNQTHKTQSFEYSKIFNNKVYWYDAKVSCLESHGETHGYIILARDITERKQTEKELLQAKKKAEQSDMLKSAFLTNMSHEIRTPLNGILGFTQLISIGFEEGDKKKVYANAIQRSSEQLLNIISDIVDISKIESGLLKLKREELSLREIFVGLYDKYRNDKNIVDSSNIEFNMKIGNGIPDEIVSDKMRITQVLEHLLNNAFKFTSKGEIEFGIRKGNSSSLLLYVKDTGVGIDTESVNFIFDQFRQEDESKTREYGGTGLGLSISKGLVKLLGGEIWVESEKNKGSIFYFTLPFTVPQKNDEVVPVPELSLEIDQDWEGKTFLIVEDEELVFEYFKEILSDTAVSYLHSKNGLEAVEICKDNPQIDIVLMDIQLPDINGFEAMKRIKEFRSELPIIAQTAYALSGDKEKALKEGFQDYITKPINRELLFATINEHLK